jgi:uncharacterized membrane protein YphA (DoxX/SURF4 family)
MNSPALNRSLLALRIVMGIVIVWLSWPTAFPQGPAEAAHFPGLGAFIRVLAGVEMLGAVLLLIPRFVRLGARTLIAVFAVAIALHLLHGETHVGPLIIYGAATAVILTADEAPRRSAVTASTQA